MLSTLLAMAILVLVGQYLRGRGRRRRGLTLWGFVLLALGVRLVVRAWTGHVSVLRATEMIIALAALHVGVSLVIDVLLTRRSP